MTEDEQYGAAYNAHERAEAAAMEAMRAALEAEPVEALAVLADPQWRWETRSWMSGAIIEEADDVLNGKLDALVGV